MAFNIEDTLNALLSYVADSGYFGSTQIGEPKAPPAANDKLSASVFLSGFEIEEQTFGFGVETHTVTIRMYLDMKREPQDQVEVELARAVSAVLTDILGDWDVAATVKYVQTGALSTTFGYLDVGGVMFRSADIVVPLVVDNAVVLTQ